MTKYITVKLTEAQANQLLHSLSNDWMDNDKQSQAFIERIQTKVRKAQALLRHQESADRINAILAQQAKNLEQ